MCILCCMYHVYFVAVSFGVFFWSRSLRNVILKYILCQRSNNIHIVTMILKVFIMFMSNIISEICKRASLSCTLKKISFQSLTLLNSCFRIANDELTKIEKSGLEKSIGTSQCFICHIADNERRRSVSERGSARRSYRSARSGADSERKSGVCNDCRISKPRRRRWWLWRYGARRDEYSSPNVNWKRYVCCLCCSIGLR